MDEPSLVGQTVSHYRITERLGGGGMGIVYMAPEQIRGGEAGPAADVWAVGVVLFQMLSGKRPFEGKDDLAVISRILDEPTPPIGALRPDLPDHLQRIVARARKGRRPPLRVGHRAAWGDPGYMFVVPNSLPADDRAASNGFRCARFPDGAALPDRLLARVDTNARDNRAAKAVSDEVFDVFTRQMAYVKAPLNARVESRDTSRPDWVRERITFDAGYENGRVAAYLFLPPGSGPRQLVVAFPGVPIGPGSSANTQPTPTFDYIIKSGRAVVLPIYKGYQERWDPFLSLQGEDYLRTFRTRMAQWRQDLGNVLDILSARPDIDSTKIAYLGLSFGGSTAFPLIVLEDRIKTAVLAPSGFTYRLMPPEADAINYVSRVKIPVLMLGGRHDYVFPLETSQKPMFERLGTPAEHKRHIVFDSGHTNFPRSETIREVLGWLDTYVGPVTSGTP